MTSEMDNKAEGQVEAVVAQGNAYDVIRKRLNTQGNELETLAKEINQARLAEFGSTELKIIARTRVRTENNCIARDIVRVGEHLLFGYNVFMGLKKETSIDDVFSVYKLREQDGELELETVDHVTTFLNDTRFQTDFNELYTYYKDTRLIQLRVNGGKLLAGFQIGERPTDVRVFRWSVSADGSQVEYIDNRGERDIKLPPAYDFEWLEVDREQVIDGRHPHISILDTIFVDTIGGDLTIKVENNTKSGRGIYAEPVVDANQSLDDAEFYYAEVGHLILLKIKPYQEEQWRFLVFNKLSEQVTRIDAIGASCVQLPENHGIVFPGGFYLQTGEYKTFDNEVPGLLFKRSIRSPNGEDVLFVFYEPIEGMVALYPYNLIDKALRNPLYAHGYGLFDDGRVVVFNAESEPTRVHPMQIWSTPFVSDLYASMAPPSQSLYGKIGNAELVRGISDVLSVVRLIIKKEVRAAHYHELVKVSSRLFDQYHWLTLPEHKAIEKVIRQVMETAELIIDEYEKVESIRQNSQKSLAEAEAECLHVLKDIQPDVWTSPQPFVEGLANIRKMRGHLLTIKEYRYIDVDKIESLEQELTQAQQALAASTVEFLANPSALKPIYQDLEEYVTAGAKVKTRAELEPVIEKIEMLGEGLDLLTETMSGITTADATVRTQIIDNISSLYARLNQEKAKAKNILKSFGSAEALAQFSAQFKLLSQSVTNGLSMSTTPERCDEQLSRLMAQLQDLESQFSEYEEFLSDILDKRDEIFETFESHKQRLLDERQRRAQTLADAAGRLVTSIKRRAEKFKDEDELNTFFSSDSLVEKIRELSKQLRELDDSVKADDVDAKFKAVKDQALRSLRDKSEIYEEGGQVIKLGPRHRFSVNTQELDLTIIPRSDAQYFHLSGTDYYDKVVNDTINESRPYWDMSLVSESKAVYRSEFLAYSVLLAAERHTDSLALDELLAIVSDEEAVAAKVKAYSEPRYKEGYERGIHDHDATKLLLALLPRYSSAGLLRFDPEARALAQLFWATHQRDEGAQNWPAASKSALQLQRVFGKPDAIDTLIAEVHVQLKQFTDSQLLAFDSEVLGRAADYLSQELGGTTFEFVQTRVSQQLAEQLRMEMSAAAAWAGFEENLRQLKEKPGQAFVFATQWLSAFVEKRDQVALQRYIPEAAALLVCGNQLRTKTREFDLSFKVEGLIGQHECVRQGAITGSLDEFLLRLDAHCQRVVPGYKAYLETRHAIIEHERDALKLDQFKARPLSSFVRNKLINESYLPLIGDNLAKQMGTVGENKRTDLMGLLMMISPPGYGKTTLMEYVANRLGLVFMKINCPSIGHVVDSLDPAQAPNATAKQELEKLNLGLEMANNTMLYLDDIQHTNPEFLQKFISLCDGTRRIEGVWRGKTKTYDLRGKKFCVVMAGNPYTESGEVFKIPDMLANRADIYNLGDVLGGMEEVFALSYIENSMTSNAVLAPLATRPMADFYRFVDKAKGREVQDTDFEHPYSGAEINEIVATLHKLFEIQGVVLKVNQQYIASAAQDDQYRTEPPFKLQGSYRNMNKMAEKVSAVMTDDELIQLIDDHYIGESQLLTKGTEENLLKLREIRGTLSAEDSERWAQIKKEFVRQKSMGGSDADVGSRVVAQLHDLSAHMENIGLAVTTARENAKLTDSKALQAAETNQQWSQTIADLITRSQTDFAQTIDQTLVRFSKALAEVNHHVQVVNQPVPGIDTVLKALAGTIENSIFPLVKAMDGKISLDLKTHQLMKQVLTDIKTMETHLAAKPAK